MIVKFNKNIRDYKYILSFDLAKHNTGWALIDISKSKVPMSGMIICDGPDDEIWSDMLNKIVHVIETVSEFCGKNKFFVLKEKLPTQAGRFSTISTLQALAQTHAVFSIACKHTGVDIYDADGVHSVSVKAYFKAITGIEKPTKENISSKISELYKGIDVSKSTLDVTDAIACVATLIGRKWDADIVNEVKELKKELKKYKSDKKKEEILTSIEKLNKLMFGGDNNG